VLTCAAASILGGLTGCVLLEDRIDCAEVPEMLPITAPPSAGDVTETCSMGINPTYRATFDMSPDDLKTFQSGTPITDWRTEGSDNVVGEYIDGAVSVEAHIDTSNANRYVVQYRATFID
jgi:hypothetical protein